MKCQRVNRTNVSIFMRIICKLNSFPFGVVVLVSLFVHRKFVVEGFIRFALSSICLFRHFCWIFWPTMVPTVFIKALFADARWTIRLFSPSKPAWFTGWSGRMRSSQSWSVCLRSKARGEPTTPASLAERQRRPWIHLGRESFRNTHHCSVHSECRRYLFHERQTANELPYSSSVCLHLGRRARASVQLTMMKTMNRCSGQQPMLKSLLATIIQKVFPGRTACTTNGTYSLIYCSVGAKKISNYIFPKIAADSGICGSEWAQVKSLGFATGSISPSLRD